MSGKPLLERSRQAVWHPCTQMKSHEQLPLVPLSRGEGIWLYDEHGRRLLDGVSSWWVNLFGHCNPRINDAISEQLETLEHAMLAGFTHEPVVQLSERLSALTGRALGHAFYASDGASATEIALKMSMHAWRNQGRSGKTRFLSLSGSYHGETVGALAVTDVALFRDAYAPLIQAGATVMSPDARAAEEGESAADVAERAALELEHYLDEHHDDIAAFIVEPLVQGACGMAMYDPHYLQRVRELCNRYEVHLIADEIAVGCGRTGTFFACEQADIWPDFICLSKGISGGYLPLSLVLTTDDIYTCFYDDDVRRGFLHSHSYTGNALACRAALATLDIFDKDSVLEANRRRATLLGNASHVAFAKHPRVRHLRQRGMIVAFDVADADAGFSTRYFQNALDRELLLRPLGNTVYFMPPYIVESDDITHLVDGALKALDATLTS
ncbi:adenosylmethionine--8-amino-7-oxononanoate transaminase [Nitrogeniibacter aestuarii]|uniref:adenosylmethionine--8-amino-7-oxononanoate transaminase n=1 Tax=Nitrogeniibacter aestuarii TaxID=2815343 RepID=UPI001E4C0D3F|nr:adenosylmethionine--8-amino-7-oxononanoate transaminase [Nitrogeniibacter aestuarii]